MDSQGRKVLVCDNGTGVRTKYFKIISSLHNILITCYPVLFQFVKVGYAGSNFPAHIFPSLVGRPIIRAANKIGDIEVKVKYCHWLKLLRNGKSYLWNLGCSFADIYRVFRLRYNFLGQWHLLWLRELIFLWLGMNLTDLLILILVI